MQINTNGFFELKDDLTYYHKEGKLKWLREFAERAFTFNKENTTNYMLNENQLKAVENVYEPTLVIAGPGTGKTELLSARIDKIITDTDAGLENILCLTYSRAGVKAMRERLEKKYNKEFSEQVQIHTFHSFCADVMKNHYTYFSHKAISLMDDIKLFEYLYPLITDEDIAGLNFSQKPPSEYILNDFAKLIKLIKEEKFEINELIDATQSQIEELENSYNRRTGALTKVVIKEIERCEKTIDALKLISELNKRLESSGLYEYNDMLYWVLEFFNNHPEHLQSYRERFQFVLVDEFQDTNPLQISLLNQLIIKNGDTHPSFFAVGDDDQCIYRFQGASVETIINITKELPAIKKIVLTHNYRSTQDILNIANNLISHNENRVVNKLPNLSKKLLAAKNENKTLKTIPRIWHCNSKVHEAKIILNDIKNKIENENCTASDFAILFRNRSHGEELISIIQKSGLSYYSKDDNNNLLDKGFVLDIDNALQFIKLEALKKGSGDGYFFKIIMNQKNKFNVLNTVALLNDFKIKRTEKFSFTQALLETQGSDRFPELFESLKELVSKLYLLVHRINDKMTEEHWGVLFDALKINKANDENEKDWDDFFENEKQYRKNATILDWAEMFMSYRIYNKKISVEIKNINKGITLSTVHGSKGLEFKHVYIIGCSNNKWEKEDINRNKFKIPHLTYNETNEIEDKRRLFYVGITRAEHSITFSYYKDGRGRNGSYELSRYVKEAVTNFKEVEKKINTNSSVEKIKFDYKQLLNEQYEYALQKIKNEFKFSSSSFSNYITCSSKFLLSNILNIPDTGNEAMSFGSAIHEMLQQIEEEKFKSNELTNVNDFIDKNWLTIIEKFRHEFISKHFLQYQEYGKQVLKQYFKNFGNNSNSNKIFEIEKTLYAEILSTRIKGKLDNIEIGNEIKVIDYKTGSNYADKWKEFEDDENIGGTHWIQAMFYLALAKDNYKNKENYIIEFHYVENDGEVKKSDVVKELKQDFDMESWNTFIQSKWDELQNFDFKNACLDTNCEYCKTLNLV
jgi:DNA helicase-2/ATP-dependent DNA helicase PcrA